MAGFKTHISTSTVVGIGYGAAGLLFFDAPFSTCLLAGGLCSVSGMLPDLDSDSGVPVRETMALAAAVTPLLMMDRMRSMGLSHEAMVVAGGTVYVIVRFGVSRIFKKYTVHRGMWHSIPACLIAGLLAFLACSSADMEMRCFKTGGVVLGFMTHLILDEIWSMEFRRGRLRFKKSFGTAIKLWSKKGWANFSTYAKLLLLSLIAIGDPVAMEHFGFHPVTDPRIARQRVAEAFDDFPGRLSEAREKIFFRSDSQTTSQASPSSGFGAPASSSFGTPIPFQPDAPLQFRADPPAVRTNAPPAAELSTPPALPPEQQRRLFPTLEQRLRNAVRVR